jgi:glycosyltransferase involved in cell wall biosynthesis
MVETIIMQKLLIMTDWFYPGFKAGGLISASYNLTMLLKDQFEVYIMTTDRDLGNSKPYKNIIIDEWTLFRDTIRIYYASPGKLNKSNILTQIKRVQPDCIYLNSMFSIPFTIFPLLIKKAGLTHAQIVLSPSGMLKPSALQQKRMKKKCYLMALRFLKIRRLIRFHATDKQEQQEIKNVFGPKAIVNQVLCPSPPPADNIVLIPKVTGEVKLVFVGRIHPVKNLYFLIECLQRCTQKIKLTIVGPIENKAYYQQCKELEKQLPENIKLHYTGPINSDKIRSYLNNSHFLALPTQGENFGYAIIEALGAGRPVIITDQTPWKNLTEHKRGWDLPLNDHTAFVEAIDKAAVMDQHEYNTWSKATYDFACWLQSNSIQKELYIRMFSHTGLSIPFQTATFQSTLPETYLISKNIS